MEPQIRYVRSADGTNIAYSTLGQGRPLVFVGTPGNLLTIDSDWRIPRLRRGMERIAERRMFVHTDARGRGLSDHNIMDRSLDAHVDDLRSVVETLSDEPVDLMASVSALLVAYAVRHPARVRKMIVSLTLPGAAGGPLSPVRRKIGELAALDFDFYKQVLALRNFGWIEGRIAAEQIRELSLDEMSSGYKAMRGWDDRAELPDVQCPVLVVHRRGAEVDVPLAESRRVAASLPNAELRVVNAGGTTMFDEEGLVARAIIEFLDRDDTLVEPAFPSGTAIILFADIVDSTALTERLGDTVFRTASRALDEAMRAAMREAGGTAVDGKVLGDGVMGVFTSASEAIVAARRCIELSAESELRLHVGLHAGDVIRERDNVYGGAVNIASRICGLSAPGEVLVSATIRDLARTSAGVTFADRGKHALKGIDDAVRLYAVREGASAPAR